MCCMNCAQCERHGRAWRRMRWPGDHRAARRVGLRSISWPAATSISASFTSPAMVVGAAYRTALANAKWFPLHDRGVALLDIDGSAQQKGRQ